MSNAWSNFKDGAKSVWDSASSGDAQGAWDAAKDTATSTAEGAKQDAQNAYDSASDAATGAVNQAGEAADSASGGAVTFGVDDDGQFTASATTPTGSVSGSAGLQSDGSFAAAGTASAGSHSASAEGSVQGTSFAGSGSVGYRDVEASGEVEADYTLPHQGGLASSLDASGSVTKGGSEVLGAEYSAESDLVAGTAGLSATGSVMGNEAVGVEASGGVIPTSEDGMFAQGSVSYKGEEVASGEMGSSIDFSEGTVTSGGSANIGGLEMGASAEAQGTIGGGGSVGVEANFDGVSAGLGADVDPSGDATLSATASHGDQQLGKQEGTLHAGDLNSGNLSTSASAHVGDREAMAGESSIGLQGHGVGASGSGTVLGHEVVSGETSVGVGGDGLHGSSSAHVLGQEVYRGTSDLGWNEGPTYPSSNTVLGEYIGGWSLGNPRGPEDVAAERALCDLAEEVLHYEFETLRANEHALAPEEYDARLSELALERDVIYSRDLELDDLLRRFEEIAAEVDLPTDELYQDPADLLDGPAGGDGGRPEESPAMREVDAGRVAVLEEVRRDAELLCSEQEALAESMGSLVDSRQELDAVEFDARCEELARSHEQLGERREDVYDQAVELRAETQPQQADGAERSEGDDTQYTVENAEGAMAGAPTHDEAMSPGEREATDGDDALADRDFGSGAARQEADGRDVVRESGRDAGGDDGDAAVATPDLGADTPAVAASFAAPGAGVDVADLEPIEAAPDLGGSVPSTDPGLDLDAPPEDFGAL
ncbi:MAG: hypothetical protein JJU45_01825 [Acidimicrobiia bacterium]|nr:hypothetical protein [Acidimicrobiia bacterium]